jgi:hypothetical protein
MLHYRRIGEDDSSLSVLTIPHQAVNTRRVKRIEQLAAWQNITVVTHAAMIGL